MNAPIFGGAARPTGAYQAIPEPDRRHGCDSPTYWELPQGGWACMRCHPPQPGTSPRLVTVVAPARLLQPPAWLSVPQRPPPIKHTGDDNCDDLAW